MRYGGRDSYGSRDRRSYGGRFGGNDGRYETRYGKTGRELVGNGFAGERTECVPYLERRDTSELTAVSGGHKEALIRQQSQIWWRSDSRANPLIALML